MPTPTRPTVRHSVLLPAALALVGALVGGSAAGRAPAGSPGVPSSAPGGAKGTLVTEVSRACWYVFQAKNGDYWFGSDGQGGYRWDAKTLVNYTTADGVSGNSIRGIQGDKAGNVWLSPTGGGIWQYDGESTTRYPVNDTQVFRIFKDTAGVMWLGTPTAGPYRFNGKAFEQFRPILNRK